MLLQDTCRTTGDYVQAKKAYAAFAQSSLFDEGRDHDQVDAEVNFYSALIGMRRVPH